MIESELKLGNRGITSEEIKKIYGIDYKRLVTDMLSELGFLPDGHILNFFDSPIKHKGSQAFYFLEEMIGNHMVYISHLDPNNETTQHKHPELIKENYFQLSGSSHLLLGDNFYELREGSALTVPSDTFHQLTTREDPSLVLIVTENAISVPRDKLHIQVA